VAAVRSFIAEHRIETLNVAGSRASKEPAVGEFVRDVLTQALLPKPVRYLEAGERWYPMDGGPPIDNMLTR
jgi:hypothetical protein